MGFRLLILGSGRDLDLGSGIWVYRLVFPLCTTRRADFLPVSVRCLFGSFCRRQDRPIRHNTALWSKRGAPSHLYRSALLSSAYMNSTLTQDRSSLSLTLHTHHDTTITSACIGCLNSQPRSRSRVQLDWVWDLGRWISPINGMGWAFAIYLF